MSKLGFRIYITCAILGASVCVLKFVILPDHRDAGDIIIFFFLVAAALVATFVARRNGLSLFNKPQEGMVQKPEASQ
jgi:hypothetical protein